MTHGMVYDEANADGRLVQTGRGEAGRDSGG